MDSKKVNFRMGVYGDIKEVMICFVILIRGRLSGPMVIIKLLGVTD